MKAIKTLITLCLFSTLLFANEKISIGVPKFENLNPNKSHSHLSIVLTSSLENSIKNRNQLSVVDRTSLKELYKEIELHADDSQLNFTPVDLLVLGSFIGHDSALSIFIKILDTQTKKSVYQKQIQGDLEIALEQFYSISEDISQLKANSTQTNTTGYLNLIGQPKGARVYENQVLIGTLPLHEVSLKEGKHTFRVQAKNYTEEKFELNIKANKLSTHEIKLSKHKRTKHFLFGVGLQFQKASNKIFENGYQPKAFLGYQYNQLSFIFSGGASKVLGINGNLKFKNQWKVPSDIEPLQSTDREIQSRFFNFSIQYLLSPKSQYFCPFIAIGGGVLWMEDHALDPKWFDEKIYSLNSPYYNLDIGFKIMPASPISFSILGQWRRSTKKFPIHLVDEVQPNGQARFDETNENWQDLQIGINIIISKGASK